MSGSIHNPDDRCSSQVESREEGTLSEPHPSASGLEEQAIYSE